MPIIRFDIKLPDKATIDDVADALARLKREMEWLVNGNLDVNNIRTDKVTQADSTATDVAGLRADFNTLLDTLRSNSLVK